MISSLLLRSAFSVVPTLPQSVLAFLARATASIEYAFAVGRRRAVVSNLEQIARCGHPSLARGWQLDQAARSIFASYHRLLWEYLAQESLDAATLDARFRLHGMEVAYGALSRGRGAVICAPHVGNWELSGIALARLGFLVHVVTGVQFHRRWTAAAREMKARQRILVTTPEDGYAPLLATLRGGGVVVLLTDGDVFVRSHGARFFGRIVPFPAGPALLARRARAPILHAHAQRDPCGRHIVSFDGIELSDPTLSLHEDVQRLTRRVAEAQERIIAAHVDQWCIFRPVFRSADAA